MLYTKLVVTKHHWGLTRIPRSWIPKTWLMIGIPAEGMRVGDIQQRGGGRQKGAGIFLPGCAWGLAPVVRLPIRKKPRAASAVGHSWFPPAVLLER